MEKSYQYSVEFECHYNGKTERRKILSSVALKNEEIQKLVPTLEETFEYTPGSCIQI